MIFRNWPGWLKGSFISFIILVCAYLIFTLEQIIQYSGSCPFFEGHSFEICWFFPLSIAVMALIPVLVVGAIIGAIVGYVCKSHGTKQEKGWKLGFWIGLVLGVLIFLIFVADGKWWVPGAWVVSIGIIAVSTLIGWIIGKFI